MIEKDPTSYSLITYAWVMLLSCWGGVANYIRKVKAGQAEKFSIMEVVGEIVISAFAGVLTFWLCELATFPPLLTAAFVGVSGHMGSRAIALFEDQLKRKWGERGDPMAISAGAGDGQPDVDAEQRAGQGGSGKG